MNTYHLMQNPGSSTVQALGGLHSMCGWQKPIFTDSGGFQIYSLIRQNPKYGSLSNRGATFRPAESGKKFHLTPEKSIQLQLAYGSDVVICLDDCTHVDAPFSVQEESVHRTIHWARRSKIEFQRNLEQKNFPADRRPYLFAVIQGGGSQALRKRCAEALLDIGFDGYGYGGWPLDHQGNLLQELLAYTRELIPGEFPLHALGVAHPANVVKTCRLGYDIFDGAMPTRDARHGRLYAFRNDPALSGSLTGEDWFSFVYAHDDKYIKDNRPVHPFCDCLLCSRFSLGYLHHLFKIADNLAFRLATIHNLRFMMQLTRNLRNSHR